MSDHGKTILSFRDLKLAYDPEQILLNGVSATLRKGEMIALLGKNGAGKSTLLRTLAGMQKALEGDIRVKDKLISDLSLRKRSQIIAFVSAGISLSEDMNVMELVSLGRHPYTNWWGQIKREDMTRIHEALGFVGMQHFADKKVSTLSDGERQRIMIARALVQDSEIIILDEPTAFLDIPNKISIANVLNDLRHSGKTVLFSTHDFDTALQYSDKMWVLNDKNLIDGAPEDLGIQHVFDQIFDPNIVTFDCNEMKFKSRRVYNKALYMKQIEDEVHRWTISALNRIGIKTENKSRSDIPELTIDNRDSTPSWIYKNKSTTLSFFSLYDLTVYLTKED